MYVYILETVREKRGVRISEMSLRRSSIVFIVIFRNRKAELHVFYPLVVNIINCIVQVTNVLFYIFQSVT